MDFTRNTGCEGRPEGKPAMDKVWLEDENQHTIVIEIEDEKLSEEAVKELNPDTNILHKISYMKTLSYLL